VGGTPYRGTVAFFSWARDGKGNAGQTPVRISAVQEEMGHILSVAVRK